MFTGRPCGLVVERLAEDALSGLAAGVVKRCQWGFEVPELDKQGMSSLH